MSERKAVYYGQVKLIPGIICDGYVLDDGTAVMSERGTAKLLGVDQRALNRVRTTGLPKTLEPFIDKGLIVRTTSVEVIAQNNPHKGRQIEVYCSSTIETIMKAYVLALANRKLQKNQRHVGERCAILQCALVRTALDAAIKEACGFVPEIQTTVQKHYVDAVELVRELGFTCTIPNDIATKQDIATFLKIPESTLSSFLYKHRDEIKATRLDTVTIRSIGSKASRMNGYHLDEVVKIAFGMDTEVGIKLKKRLFGHIGMFVTPHVKDEIQWRKILAEVFKGFDLCYNYSIGKYRVDFFVAKLGTGLVLECNGFSHKYYDSQEEAKREKAITDRYALVRFHPNISLETLFNGILQAKNGSVVRLYDLNDIGRKSIPNLN